VWKNEEAAVMQGDNCKMEKLLEVFSRPYEHSIEKASYCRESGGKQVLIEPIVVLKIYIFFLYKVLHIQ